MKFERIQAANFGRLSRFETGPLGGLVIVHGPNESGKSTLFNALVTLLFGFSPANSASHPYFPWEGGSMEISADLIMDNGEKASVFRRMTSSIRGRHEREKQGEEISNKSLGFLNHISRDVFCEVYALSARDLEFFRDKTWREVQDGLVPGLSPEFLLPLGQVLPDLEREMNSLWRPTRHRGTQARKIQDALAALRAERKEAEGREEMARERRQRLSEIEVRKEALMREKIRLRALLRKVRRLAPIRLDLAKLDQLEKEAGPLEDLEGFPESAWEFIQTKEQHLKKMTLEIEVCKEEALRYEKRVASFTPSLARVWDKEESIVALDKEAAEWRGVRSQREDLDAEALELKARFRESTRDLLTEDCQPSMLLAISRAEVLSATRAFEEAHNHFRAEEERLKGMEGQVEAGRRPLPLLNVLLGSLGLILVVIGGLLGRGWMAILGSLFTAIFAGGLYAWYRMEQQYRQALGTFQSVSLRRDQWAEEKARCRRRVVELLGDLPAAKGRLERPDAAFFQDLMEARAIAESLRSREETMKRLESSLSGSYEKVLELAMELGLESSSPDTAIGTLREHLSRAREASRVKEEALEALESMEGKMKMWLDEAKEVESDLQEVKDRLIQMGAGDLKEGIEILQKRRNALQRYSSLKDEIERTPDIEAVKTEIRELEEEGQTWIFTDEEVEIAQARLEEVEKEDNELDVEAATINEALSHEGGPTPDDLDSEAENLRIQMKEVARHRDRLLLIKTILVEAERRFKEEHQPDVLRKAGQYLKRITSGVYQGLSLEETSGNPVLLAHTSGPPVPVTHPLSRGALDQIYLALRFSLVDHLDEARETLPLFLDEVLVNWGDGERLNQGMTILEDLSKIRQVFVFTCHSWLAERLKQRFEAQDISFCSESCI